MQYQIAHYRADTPSAPTDNEIKKTDGNRRFYSLSRLPLIYITKSAIRRSAEYVIESTKLTLVESIFSINVISISVPPF